MMPILVIPAKKYLASYTAAFAESAVHGVTAYSFSNPHMTDVFAKFERYRTAANLPPNRVGADYYWLVDESARHFIGEITVRHHLTEALLHYGGHIGYGIRPSEWNKGYGTLMLSMALEKARGMGLDRVLVTCDDDNIASARVAEKNGFVMLDRITNDIDNRRVITRRYIKQLAAP